MKFCIADSFQTALRRLSAQEQKAVKETVFDLQMNPAAPGLQFHRIDKSKDPNFWSMRVNRDVRLIVHKTQDSLLICYVAHHDDAYIETVADESELDEVHDTERNLFYVACTRARDRLLISGVRPASEFFADFSPPKKASN